ncbi:MAG: glycosyltransferase family 39 protein [Planctomycetia bacterium]|nr:glycosyltransferase family 39 protein [Planctomycetia bacterium]
MRCIASTTVEVLIPQAGLGLVGALLQDTRLQQRFGALDVEGCQRPDVKHGDAVSTAVGLLCLGRSDFNDAVAGDQSHSQEALGRQGIDVVRFRSSLLLRLSRAGPAMLFGLFTLLLAWSATRNSPVVGEVNHLPAGLSHLFLGRFDLFRVNPPLVRMVAALPVALMQPATNWEQYDASPVVRSDLVVGQDFLNANGFRSLRFFTVGRWACIPFSLLGGYICLRWARELYGTAAGFVALVLWCSCPYILGHGALFTPDAHSAAIAVTALYCFWRWLRHAEFTEAVFAGIVLGLAELAKFTLLIFYPLVVLTWFVYRLPAYGFRNPGRWLRDGGMLMSMVCLSIVVINLGYGCEGSLRPIAEYQFQSQLFSGLASNPGPARAIGNRFAHTWAACLPVPVPANFLQGIDTQRLDFERGLPSYLGGEWSKHGWWYYYLYALAIKMPLGTWCLVALALAVTVFGRGYSASWRDEMVVLMPFVVILVFVSSQTGFSIHSRYVIPALPFLFVWTGKVVRVFEMHPFTNWRVAIATMVCFALAWSVGSSLSCYPHSLSYFNELVGGPMNGHYHLLDSNIAWGQDLFFLKRWYDDHPNARPFHLAHSGLIDPRLAGIEFTLPPVGPASETPQAASTSPKKVGPLPGWYAIDVNHLHGAEIGAANGEGGWQSVAGDSYDLTYFQRFQPVARAGYSIYIYHITLDEANRVRRELGLPGLPTD